MHKNKHLIEIYGLCFYVRGNDKMMMLQYLDKKGIVLYVDQDSIIKTRKNTIIPK